MVCEFKDGNIIATNKKDNICYREHHANGYISEESTNNLITIIDEKIPELFNKCKLIKNISNIVDDKGCINDNSIFPVSGIGHRMLVAKLNGNLYVFDCNGRKKEQFLKYNNIKHISFTYDKNADRSGACVNSVDALLVKLSKYFFKYKYSKDTIDHVVESLNKNPEIKISDTIKEIESFIKKFELQPNENGVYQIGNTFYDTAGKITNEKEVIYGIAKDNRLYNEDKEREDNRQKESFVEKLNNEAKEGKER